MPVVNTVTDVSTWVELAVAHDLDRLSLPFLQGGGGDLRCIGKHVSDE